MHRRLKRVHYHLRHLPRHSCYRKKTCFTAQNRNTANIIDFYPQSKAHLADPSKILGPDTKVSTPCEAENFLVFCKVD